MLRRIDSRELTEWMAYEKVAGPIGGERGDLQAAAIAMTVANSLRSKGRAFKLGDFTLRWGPQQEQEPEELLALALALNKSLGGVDLRGDDRRADDPPGGGE